MNNPASSVPFRELLIHSFKKTKAMDEYELVMGMTGWPEWISITGNDTKENFLNDVSEVFQMGASGQLGFWASQYFMQNR